MRTFNDPVPFNNDINFIHLLEAVPDAVVITNKEGNIILVNYQLEKTFGWSREEIIGKPVEFLTPERFRSGHEKYRSDYFSNPWSRPMGTNLELWGMRKDGFEFPVEVSLSPLQINHEWMVIAVIRDITERKQQSEQRERELHILAKMTAPPSTIVTARTFGVQTIHETSEIVFNELVTRYAQILDDAVEQRTYNVHHDITEKLRELAMDIGILRGGPRDVIEIHTLTMSKKMQMNTHEKSQVYIQEGRLLVLELMGNLVMHYRTQSVLNIKQ